ncbi:MAG TPA: MFS transporter [Ureibacillus sp.]|nr:MFS transporter [Ureibacillus sp.]
MKDPQRLTRYHLFLTLVTFLGWAISAMDASLFFFIGPSIMERFDFDLQTLGYISGAGFLLAIIFSFVVGPIMDYLGRKIVFQWILVLVTLGTFSSGVAWNFTSLVIYRLIATGSAFAEYAVGATILVESVPKRHRGWIIGIMAAGWPAGTAFAGIITQYSIPVLGWRSAFFIATIPAFIIIVIRLFVEEADEFKEESIARNSQFISLNEKSFYKFFLYIIGELKNNFISIYREVLSGRNLYNTVLVSTYINSFVVSYSLLIWFAPYWMRDAFGFNLFETTNIVVLGSLVSVIGFISCGWIGGHFGIFKTNLIFLPISVLLIIWMNHFDNTLHLFLVGYFLWSFFGSGLWGIIPRLFTEKFHTSIRGAAASLNSASCWLGWAIICIFSSYIFENIGYSKVILISSIALFPVALIASWFLTKD